MSRPKRKNKNNQVIEINEHQAFKKKKKVEIIPRNTKQEEYFDYLNDEEKRIVFALGPAGTGKTILATLQAIKLFKEEKIDKILISRPAVEVAGERHGFLPGDLNSKMEPWCLPIMDIFEDYYHPKDIRSMIDKKIIEIAPLAYLRGRTFKNSVVILDESQNTLPNQMKMILTRIGEGTRVFVTGDIKQTDIRNINGLEDIFSRLKSNPQETISLIEFTKEHVERDEIVKSILDLYGEDD